MRYTHYYVHIMAATRRTMPLVGASLEGPKVQIAAAAPLNHVLLLSACAWAFCLCAFFALIMSPIYRTGPHDVLDAASLYFLFLLGTNAAVRDASWPASTRATNLSRANPSRTHPSRAQHSL